MTLLSSALFRLLLVPLLALAALVVAASLRDGFYTRLAAILVAFVLVVDLATFVRGRLQNALVTCATLLFGLAVIEGVALAWMPRTVMTHAKDLYAAHPDLGWAPARPGQYPDERTENGKVIYKAVYTIDADLLRRVKSNLDGPLLAFFGDSFTFGTGVNDDETLPQQFANMAPALHVLNLALSGYSPAHMLRRLQVGLSDKQLEGARLFLILTGPLHAERIACKTSFSLRAPRYVTVDNKIEYKGPCSSGLWRKIREFVAETAIERVFVSPVTRRLTHADVVNYLNVMSAIADMSHDKYHVPLAVIYVPALDHMLDGTGFDDEQIKQALKADGIHIITYELDETLPIRIPVDGHFTGVGNKIIAQSVFDDLEATMPKVLQARP